MSLTAKDVAQIRSRGISEARIQSQIENFRRGFPYLPVREAARPGHGILMLDDRQRDYYKRIYDRFVSSGRKIVKFVPASGAATRMFKDLYEFVNEGRRSRGVEELLAGLDRLPFYPELMKILPEGADERAVAAAIVGQGLGYGSKPKALVLFHRYGEQSRTALEEHLAEGAQYASAGGRVRIHFTVSPEHRQGFAELLGRVVPDYESRYGVKYDISFSEQNPATDTIAVNPDNSPFRCDDGSLLFRPAGHGALIGNLNDIEADLIFIKNIDNVTTEQLRPVTVEYKKVLAGLLVDLQRRCHKILHDMDAGVMDLTAVAGFIRTQLCVQLPEEYYAEMLRSVLNRPLRVCGMVRNDGEPGGGPFWVGNPDGTVSLQIAESSQIAPEDRHLMSEATHFNPVDLVCSAVDYRGRKFDLNEYVDPSTGFISEKSYGGRPLRAQELPGLWNGAMARWNTVFVDVPTQTFTPVKTVADLLRSQHQPQNM